MLNKSKLPFVSTLLLGLIYFVKRNISLSNLNGMLLQQNPCSLKINTIQVDYFARISYISWSGLSLYFSMMRFRPSGRVVSVSVSQSSDPGFESRSGHFLDLFLSSPEFKSSATFVNNQLVCLRPVKILNNVIMFNLKLFQLFAWPH